MSSFEGFCYGKQILRTDIEDIFISMDLLADESEDRWSRSSVEYQDISGAGWFLGFGWD